MNESRTFNDAIHELASELADYASSHPSKHPLDDIDYTIKKLAGEISPTKDLYTEPYWRRIACCAAEGFANFMSWDDFGPLFTDVAKLVIKKQKDYGTGNILNSPFGPENGLVVRLYDKVARLKNLTANKKKPNNESIEDTWSDIVGYSMIGIMVEREVFTLPLV